LTEEKYKLLCLACDSVLLADDARIEAIAIPWLHVMREHPIFLHQYEDLFTEKYYWKTLVDYFFLKSKRTIQWIRLIWHLFKLPNNFWIGELKKPHTFDVIFVSHLLNASQLSVEDDFYFNQVPHDLVGHGIKVLIVLINHTSVSTKILNSRINSLSIPRVVIAEYLPIIEEFRIWWQTKKQSKLFRQSAKNESDEFRKRVLKKSIAEATSHATKISLRIARSISEITRHTQARMIITTYEGHAWERTIFAMARTANQDIKCIGYQHAALFRLQHSAKRSLGATYDPDLILTAGPVGLSQLKGSESLTGIKLGILGSSRSLKISQRSFTATCLVLPEGITKECEILFSFSLKCAISYPDIHFIWRLHPIIAIDDLVRCGLDLGNLPSNIEISSQTFEADIARCKWALYRGSTAIITAAANGVIPIYLMQAGELSIDPLYEIGDSHLSISYSHQFLDALEKSAVNPKLIEYCTQFYSPFDVSILADQLTCGA
jgi:hypothetical protein